MKRTGKSFRTIIGVSVAALLCAGLVLAGPGVQTGGTDGENPEQPGCGGGDCGRADPQMATGEVTTGCPFPYHGDYPDDNLQETIDLMVCYEDNVPPTYGPGLVWPLDPGDPPTLLDFDPDEGQGESEPDCIGFWEEEPGIGKVTLTYPDSFKVARLDYFDQHPDPAPENTNAGVRIRINGTPVSVPTTQGMSMNMLNQRIGIKLALTSFNVVDHGTYWSISDTDGIWEFEVEADDEGLTRMGLELRPPSSDLSIKCGNEGYLPENGFGGV